MINQTIQSFTIQKEIGKGGMATVYLAKNNIGKKAAIKVLNKKYLYDDQVKKRFVQEATLMAQMEHENICSVISLEDNDEFSAIIMEYLEGQDLKSYVNKYKAVPEATVMKWLKQIAPALDYAHSKGTVHRDIKPSNFLLTPKKDQIKLMDFGIAKAEDSIITTYTNMKMGSPVYMSPEQIQSPKDVDNKADIYSLGVTLHHLLSGEIPCDTTTQSSSRMVEDKVINEALPLLNNISKRMNAIIQSATQRDKKDRPNKVADLLKVETGESEEKLKPVKKDGKWGFTDENGNTKIPLIYDKAFDFKEGLAKVKKDGKWFYINKQGNCVKDCEEDLPKVQSTQRNVHITGIISLVGFFVALVFLRAGFMFLTTWGVVNLISIGFCLKNLNKFRRFSQVSVKNKLFYGVYSLITFALLFSLLFIPPIKIFLLYEATRFFEEELTLVKKDEKEGWVDKNGNTKIPFNYNTAYPFSEGLARVKKKIKWGFIDKNGTTKIPFNYDRAWSFKEGLACVEKDGKWGWIDKNGNTKIPLIYDFTWPFSEGLAWVKKDGNFGFIDKNGNTKIPLIYDYAESFSGGLARIKKDGKEFYINKQGDYVKDYKSRIQQGKDEKTTKQF